MEDGENMHCNISNPPFIKDDRLGAVLKLGAPLKHSIISVTQQNET